MKTLTTLLLTLIALTSFKAQITHTDTTILIEYLSVQTLYIDIVDDVDGVNDISISNNESIYNAVGVIYGGEILSINNNEIVRECQGYLDEFKEWQNTYAYMREQNVTEVTEGEYNVPFRLLRLDTVDNQHKYKYGYLNVSILNNLDMIVTGWNINNTWNEGIDCDYAYTEIKEQSLKQGKGAFVYYDLNGRVLNQNNLPLNQIVIKAYDNGVREKIINTYNY